MPKAKRTPEQDERLEKFGNWMRRRRASIGMSQRQLADSVGIEKSTWRRWEDGTYNPNIDVVAEAFNVSVDYLLRVMSGAVR
jgi:transcriptional regulator with XRE-family HTH domain